MIDFNQPIIDARSKEPIYITVPVRGEYVLDAGGNPFKDERGKKIPATTERVMSLQHVVGEACAVSYQDEPSLDPLEKRKRAKVIDKVFDSDAGELTSEDAAIIRHCVGKLYGPLIVGAVDKILSGL